MSESWISLHIFYSSNANPVIVDVIAPLVEDLRVRGTIQRYFFIKYWMEGPHVRLRLQPAPGVTKERVKQEIEPMINAYLERRPALYDIDQDEYRSFHKDMFIAEYGQNAWDEKFGEVGEMGLRGNNTWHYIEYEPEYRRYGGVDGVELAEWHFEKSSDIVVRCLRDTNVHVRPILLGLSIQISLPLCFAFLRDDVRVQSFLKNYIRYWQETFHQNSVDMMPDFEKKYTRLAPDLQRRITEIRHYIVDGTPGHLTELEREWASHIAELRRRVDDLVAQGKLVFAGKGVDGGTGPIEENDFGYYEILLSSYIHMTNNRLGVSILDEIYLSYILQLALEERMKSNLAMAS